MEYNQMLLMTTETLPQGLVITKSYSMIFFNGQIEISAKGLIRGLIERNRNEYQETLNQFASLAPHEANAIIGIQVSSAIQQYKNGTFQYLTFVGTPITYTEA